MTAISQQLWTNNWVAIAEVILFPALLIICLRRVSHSCKQLIANRYGTGGQLFFGWLGIAVHELSHLLFAIAFGHRITGFRLLHMPKGADDRLGYVNHEFNPNQPYQRFGNLWIGIAPIFGCSLVLLLATQWLDPALIAQLATLPELNISFRMFNLANAWQLILLILISGNVAIGGFDLSDADLSNIGYGLIGLIVLTIVATSFAILLGVGSVYMAWLHQVAMSLNGILCFSLVVTILSNAVLRLITNY